MYKQDNHTTTHMNITYEFKVDNLHPVWQDVINNPHLYTQADIKALYNKHKPKDKRFKNKVSQSGNNSQ